MYITHFCEYHGPHIARDFKGLNAWFNIEIANVYRGGHNIDYRSIPQFPPRVLCVQIRKSRKTLSFDKVSVAFLQGKQFLSNLYEAVYRRQ